MPAQSTIEICPPQMLSAADGFAQHMTSAAKPATKAGPSGGGMSAADLAAIALGVKVTAHVGQLSAELQGIAPAADTQTQTGVSQMEQTDEGNAEMLRALGRQAEQILGRLM